MADQKRPGIVFRRVRGRIVPISGKLIASYGGAVGVGAVAGVLASKKTTEKAIYSIGRRISLTKAAGEAVPLTFSLRSLPMNAQKSLKSAQRLFGITEKSKAVAVIKAAGSMPASLKKLSNPVLLTGGLLAAAGAYGVGRSLFKPKKNDSHFQGTAKDLAAVGLGVGALTATNYGFFRATGRKAGQSLAAAIRYTPDWISKLSEFKHIKVGSFKNIF